MVQIDTVTTELELIMMSKNKEWDMIKKCRTLLVTMLHTLDIKVSSICKFYFYSTTTIRILSRTILATHFDEYTWQRGQEGNYTHRDE